VSKGGERERYRPHKKMALRAIQRPRDIADIADSADSADSAAASLVTVALPSLFHSPPYSPMRTPQSKPARSDQTEPLERLVTVADGDGEGLGLGAADDDAVYLHGG